MQGQLKIPKELSVTPIVVRIEECGVASHLEEEIGV